MTDSGSYVGLDSRIEDGVLRLRLNRPDKLNAVTTDLLEALADVVEENASDAVRAVVLSGAGRAFCAGADLGGSTVSLDAANRAVRALREARVPVVTLVDGPAVGLGCSLALAGDLILMNRSAYLMLGFTKIGLMPDGGATALVTASIGRARTLRMAFLSEKIYGPQAYDWGLVSMLTDDASFEEVGSQVVRQVANGPTRAFAATKHAVDAASLDLETALERECEAQRNLGETLDYHEGVEAFRQRREPHFVGR